MSGVEHTAGTSLLMTFSLLIVHFHQLKVVVQSSLVHENRAYRGIMFVTSMMTAVTTLMNLFVV